jgi:hypothetical protein
MRIHFRVVSLACLLIVPPVSAQTGHGAAPDTTHTTLIEAMKQDLRRLVKAEEAFFDRHRTYTAVLPASDFATRSERQVVVVAQADKGYSATMTTSEEPGLTCGLFHGAGQAPNPVVVRAREPACWHRTPDGAVVSDSAMSSRNR